ncbi:hypothetical protein C5167_008704 [Papaver somniferum]|uniref:Uncharacterized protein n=1 Tax=Papaver somniferum TaxID=3469 RepID=A0A4Y7JZ84_PAPSO|nr:hypothetical protein C5167_008704 [Papaver somniferum]
MLRGVILVDRYNFDDNIGMDMNDQFHACFVDVYKVVHT